jgi:predicted HAD superfamily Cof-like phosphohydrolase
MEQQLDALVDLVYVALGTAVIQGFDFEEAWRRVHAANMLKTKYSKTNPGKRNSRYDVVKPVGWVRPDLSDLVK